MNSACPRISDERPDRTATSLAVAIACCFLATVVQTAQASEMGEAALQLANCLEDKQAAAIAVVDFRNLDGSPSPLGRYLAEELAVKLAPALKRPRLVDRSHIDAVLREAKLAETGLIDPETIKKLGGFVGADTIATGTITAFGDSFRVAIKVVETSTARLLCGTTADVRKQLGPIGNSQGEGSELPQSPPTPHRSARPTARGPAARLWELEFQVHECLRASDSISCSGVVTNSGSTPKDLAVARDQVYLIDSDSRQSERFSVRFELGNGGGEQTIEPDIPVRFTVTSKGHSVTATSVSIVLNCTTRDRWGTWQKVILKSAPVH